MNAAVQRVFESKPAVREASGLMLSLVGPSGGGKTYSALRLATGIQRVVGGDIELIDTENGRALHYADSFRFSHVRFGAPFSSLDYLEALRFCAKRGAKTIIVDSMSHEHDGPGGLLEWHDREVERLLGLWKNSTVDKVNLPAWNEPKRARKRLINEMLQLNVNIILTFRAKEKLEIRVGKPPVDLGWMPICGDEFMYEMVLQMLLEPGANGVPNWKPERPGERAMVKLPQQFKEFVGGDPKQIDEDLGEQLAKWAAAGAKPAPELDKLIADYAKCTDAAGLKELEAQRAKAWGTKMPAGYKQRVKEASDAAIARVAGGGTTATTSEDGKAPSAEAWVTTLAGAQTLEDLEKSWHGCQAAFGQTPPPDVCLAEYEGNKERLGEAEGKQSDL
jgi:hypothetical protein